MFLNRDSNAPPWFAPTPYRYVLPGLQHTSVIENLRHRKAPSGISRNNLVQKPMQLYKKRIFVEQNYTSSMKKEEKVRLPYVPTYGEEVANTVSHAVMLPLTLCLLPFAAVWTYLHDARPVLASVSVSVCVISIFLMLLASTLYHSMRPDSKHKAVFHKLDHIFIFVAIAGTYTPVALLVIGGWQGVFVTVLQWTAVLLGILYKTLARRSIPALSLTIYLVMGWTAIFFLPRLIRNASLPLLLLILLGGVLYTAGAIVYAKKGFRYHHLVWHLFIDLALLSHLAGIVFFIG
jgi:hemolysin III